MATTEGTDQEQAVREKVEETDLALEELKEAIRALDALRLQRYRGSVRRYESVAEKASALAESIRAEVEALRSHIERGA